MQAVGALLDGILDYAGLFPPAALTLDVALANFAEYRLHPHARMLARFVLPVPALATLPSGELPDSITLVVKGEDTALPQLPPQVQSLEVACSLAPGTSQGRFVFHELDWRSDFERAMDGLTGRAATGVKLRTGGLTPESIPPARQVARFLLAAAQRELPIKFTAGLHAPLPHFDASIGAQLHGFLNVFGAAFAAYSGQCTSVDELSTLLRESRAAEFKPGATRIDFAGFRFSAEAVGRLRRERVISFGSCSFLEPAEHLQALGWLD